MIFLPAVPACNFGVSADERRKEEKRRELKAYLEKYGEEWRENASNGDVSIERNKVRHEIIPFLERKLDKDLVEHIYRISGFI